MTSKAAFTSVYSFLQSLKEVSPSRTQDIDQEATEHNISATDAYGPEGYPSVTLAVSNPTGPLQEGQTSETYGLINYPIGCMNGPTANLAADLARCHAMPNSGGDNHILKAAGNKSDNWQYYVVNIPAPGCYSFYAEPKGRNEPNTDRPNQRNAPTA